MARALSVDRVVRVGINLQPMAAARRNFGTLLIIGASGVIDMEERLRAYTGIDGVAADFTFTLTMRGDDVSAYDLSVELSADVDGSAPMSISLLNRLYPLPLRPPHLHPPPSRNRPPSRYAHPLPPPAPETEPPKGAVVVDLTAPEAPADPVPTSGDPAEVVIDKIYTTGGGFIGVTEG